MISASHNPFYDNGIKLLNSQGEKMDEETISVYRGLVTRRRKQRRLLYSLIALILLVFLAIGLDKAENLFDFDRNWQTINRHPGAAAVYTMLKKGDIDRTIYLKMLKVEKFGKSTRSTPVLTKKFQYSKLQDYRIIE